MFKVRFSLGYRRMAIISCVVIGSSVTFSDVSYADRFADTNLSNVNPPVALNNLGAVPSANMPQGALTAPLCALPGGNGVGICPIGTVLPSGIVLPANTALPIGTTAITQQAKDVTSGKVATQAAIGFANAVAARSAAATNANLGGLQ